MISTLGIDVSKEWLDTCFWPERLAQRYANTPAGLQALTEALGLRTVDHIVLEPSGGYERLALHMLQAGKFPVSRVNARQIRDYARAKGRLAKTDKLDAQVLAEYGSAFRPQATQETSVQHDRLRGFIRRREQVVGMVRQEKHALEHTSEVEMARLLRKHIAFMETQLEAIDEGIRLIISADEAMDARFKIMVSCKGVGFVTAATLLADMPELGAIDHKKAAALAGLAPHNRDSGQYRGQRHVSGGRTNVRRALYMAALSASIFNPDIREFKLRLKAKGKSGKCSNTACARKLLLVLNSLLRDKRMWQL
jgi:transposase